MTGRMVGWSYVQPIERLRGTVTQKLKTIQKSAVKLRGFGPLANYAYRGPPLVGEVVPTFADRGCRVVSATDPPVVSLGFLDRSHYYFFQVAPQLSSRG
jgi:hypothetical protein